ncbi:MAG: metal ABC transporter permease [Actinomycetota bacterium]|nr:metal ABC transporter permease [Actinomycetota bacterium]
MNTDALVVVLTAGLLATACGLLGGFLVLRRQSLMSDAVSHAVLPGIVLVFLLTGSRAALPTILGATAVGVACVLGFEALRRTGLVRSDAAIALTFPALFSLGVIGVSRFASGAHLDLDTAIYGEITFAPLRTVAMGGLDVPRSLLVTGPAAVLTVLLVVLLWRPLQTSTLDPQFAEIVGLRGRLAQRVLLVASTAVAVVAFDNVGAVLVVAFFVVPAAAAHLLASRLGTMLILAVTIGWVSAVVGHWAAVRLDSSMSGTIGLATVVCFALARLLAPRRGLLWRRSLKARTALSLRRMQ